MRPIISALVAFVTTLLRPRLSLQLDIVALRHQLAVYERSNQRPRIRPADRILGSWMLRHCSRWREALIFVRSAPAGKVCRRSIGARHHDDLEP